MKKTVLILALSSLGFAACNGDHTSKNGKDTVKSTYASSTNKDSLKAADSVSMDTGKTTKGDVSSEDNSASGGTKIKDTTKKN